jgi:hypothetical protein
MDVSCFAWAGLTKQHDGVGAPSRSGGRTDPSRIFGPVGKWHAWPEVIDESIEGLNY